MAEDGAEAGGGGSVIELSAASGTPVRVISAKRYQLDGPMRLPQTGAASGWSMGPAIRSPRSTPGPVRPVREFDALIADEDTMPGNEVLHRGIGFVAERA